ncbi:ABC transporter ATP-binding protein, partial [Streptomyces sp. NPDC050421]
TVVMVTHDPAAATWADRVLFLADGTFAGSLEHGSAQQIAARMAALASRTAHVGTLAGAAV